MPRPNRETKFELTGNRFLTKCTACGRDIQPGCILYPWINGCREGSVHPAPCGVRMGWEGDAAEPAIVWDVGSTRLYKKYMDFADLYELIPHPDGGHALMKNHSFFLATVPCPGVPPTVPAELQARLLILLEREIPRLPSNNENSRKSGLAFQARLIYNTSPEVEDGGVADPPEDDESVSSKEPVMAKSFIASKSVPAAAKPAAKGAAPKGKAKVAKGEAPARNPVAATEEEIQAAIAGTLGPREYTGNKNQESLEAVDENGKPKGRPLGLTTGLPVMMWWCYAFQQNERTPGQSKLPGLGRAPESKLVAACRKEFPGRMSKLHENPQTIRLGYNKGVLTRGQAPKIQSHRYDDKGGIIEGRVRSGAADKKETPAPKAAPKPAPTRKTVKA